MNIGRISTKRKNETLIKIGEKYGKTGPQVALRYLMELGVIAGCNQKNNKSAENDMKQELQLTQEWDKVFLLSDKVNHQKVTFKNHFGITLAADVYTPKSADGKKLPAIAVGGPFGAVKEQVSGLYFQSSGYVYSFLESELEEAEGL